MIKNLIACLSALIVTTVHAEEQAIRILCFPTNIVFEKLQKEYREQPIAYGRGPEGSTGVMSLWVNSTTLTWTIIVSHNEGKSCIVGEGRELTIRQIEKPKSNDPKSLL